MRAAFKLAYRIALFFCAFCTKIFHFALPKLCILTKNFDKNALFTLFFVQNAQKFSTTPVEKLKTPPKKLKTFQQCP
jgi:hypothetical protein